MTSLQTGGGHQEENLLLDDNRFQVCLPACVRHKMKLTQKIQIEK